MADLSNAVWCVMPVLANWPLTAAAISDLLAQSVPTRLLLINQGAEDSLRRELEAVAEAEPERVLVWSHDPSLPSLAATWNRALRFVGGVGGEEALVVNNDVRLHRRTLEVLRTILDGSDALYDADFPPPLFVSAVGVTAEQFAAVQDSFGLDLPPHSEDASIPELQAILRGIPKGGPDFSCFLISRACHERFPFDEALTPAFLEDLDLHRRLMLAGEGARIFSINLPFHHVGGGSQTLKTMDPAKRAALERSIQQGSRAHYAASWGGGANEERYTIKGDPTSARDAVTTPELQRRVQAGEPAVPEEVPHG